MSFMSKNELAKYKEKEKKRQQFWGNLFDKYESSRDKSTDEDDEDSDIAIEDIVEVYGRRKTNRKTSEVNNVQTGIKNRRRNERRACNRRMVIASNTKHEGDNSNGNSATVIKEDQESLIKLENNSEGTTILPRKRGRPRKNNNKTKIKIEENTNDENITDVTELSSQPVIKQEDDENIIDLTELSFQPVIKLEDCSAALTIGAPSANKSKLKVEKMEITDTQHEMVKRRMGTPPKKRRGRPKLLKTEDVTEGSVLKQETELEESTVTPPKKRRGRPKLLKTEDVAEGSVLKQETELEESTVTSLEKKSPRASNSQLNVEEFGLNKMVGRKRGKPRLNTNIKAETFVKNETEDASNSMQSEVVKKRGRLPLKATITKDLNKTSSNKEPDTIKSVTNSFKKRGRPSAGTKNATKKKPLNNKKGKSSLPIYQKYIVHSFWKKDLKKEFAYIIDDEKKLSRSYTGVPNFARRSRRSKSCINYSEKSLTLMDLSCGETIKVEPLEEKSMSNINNLSKFNTEEIDPDILQTKYIIEEKLKSNLGLIMVKRFYSLKSSSKEKENNYELWHHAAKTELNKLKKIIPMEKLEQYMHWNIKLWFSKVNNGKGSNATI